MRSSRVYRHISSIDLDVFVAAISYLGWSSVTAKVFYLNRSAVLPTNRAVSWEVDTVKIRRSDLWKWQEVNDYKS